MPTFPAGGPNARVNIGGNAPFDVRVPMGMALFTVRLSESVAEL
jgi:hypothetical protein